MFATLKQPDFKVRQGGGLKGWSVLHQGWQYQKKCQNRKENKPIYGRLKGAIKNTFSVYVAAH